MKIEEVPIESIKPYENNPRINEPAVDVVAKSIKTYGWRQPIVVDKKGVIVMGHTRRLAAIKLDLKKVPVHRALDLTAEQIRQLRLVDNKSAELAAWDFAALQTELESMPDFDASSWGFDLGSETADDFTDSFGDEDVLEDEALEKSIITLQVPREKLEMVRGYRTKFGDDEIVAQLLDTVEKAMRGAKGAGK